MMVVAALPAYEGFGVGKKVLALVRGWLWLVATPDARIRAYGFYRALGWRATAELIESEEKMVLRRQA